MTKARDLANGASALSAVSATELGYVDGVTSAIQTQLDAKIAKTLTTTTGDTIYASSANTPARLGVGSTGQVLTVAGGVPSWAAASSGLTKIATATFSASAGVAISGCFTSTYKRYMVIVTGLGDSTNPGSIFLQLQTGVSTVESSAIYYAGTLTYNSSAVANNYNDNGATKWKLGIAASNARHNFTAYFNNVGNGSQDANYTSTGNLAVNGISVSGGIVASGVNSTGLYLTGQGNITGEYIVYGLAN